MSRRDAGLRAMRPHALHGLGAGIATLVMALPALVLAWFPAGTEALQFDRHALEAGEVWRALTGHWTHWSMDHLVWDVLAFGVLTALCWREHPRRCVAAILASALLISIGAWLMAPELIRYRGLSGIDSALYVLLATTLLRRAWRARDRLRSGIFIAALLVFVAKVINEVTSGAGVFVAHEGFDPLPMAHVIGGCCGLIAGWGSTRR